MFNVSKLHPYSPPTIPSQRNPPPLEIKIDGEMEYEVEEIIDSRLIQGKLQYLIKWKGYTTKNNTWEPETNLKHTQALIHHYHVAHPNAPQRILSMEWSKLNFRPIENYTDLQQTEKSLNESKNSLMWSKKEKIETKTANDNTGPKQEKKEEESEEEGVHDEEDDDDDSVMVVPGMHKSNKGVM